MAPGKPRGISKTDDRPEEDDRETAEEVLEDTLEVTQKSWHF
jgi:hypothetical protein